LAQPALSVVILGLVQDQQSDVREDLPDARFSRWSGGCGAGLC